MASANIISRLSSQLNGIMANNRDMPDMGTRNFGGSFRNNHPYISGSFFVMFDLPDVLFGGNSEVASKWLSATCESFTPPSDTINYAEITGLGQLKSRFVTSRTTTNDITLAFREYSRLPVLNAINQWSSVIDPFLGVSPLPGSNFVPSAYKGTIYLLQTKPVGAIPGGHLTEDDIEESYIFDGCFPTQIPYDSLNSDLTTADSVQLSVTFSFDGYPLRSSEGATEACLQAYAALGHSSLMDTFDNMSKKINYPVNN